LELDPLLPKPGSVIAGKYRIERVLGLGGMGVVYAAKHELMNQDVALKLLLPEVARDKEAVARFMHEGRATARLQSPHVVRIIDVGMEASAPFLTMELLSGEDLGQIFEKRGRFLITETVDYLIEAMEGLSHAHAARIIHRDLKPSNLFLARGEGDTKTIKVVDFGISKSIGNESGNLTSTSAVLGSPAYMAPEQLRSSKHVDARVDVWSLGVIAYELLTGVMPFEGETVGAIFANVLEKTPARPRTLRVEIPGMLEEAILKCLQKSPDARYSNLAELASAIARHGTGRCDPLVASIEKRFASAGFTPIRSASIPDLELPLVAPPSKPTISVPKLPAPPISAPVLGGGFDFDDEVLSGPSLVTVDEVRRAPKPSPSKPSAGAATVMTSRAPSSSSQLSEPPSEIFRETILPVALHAALATGTFVVLYRFASAARGWDLAAMLPGTAEGAASSTSAIVGGVFAASAIGVSIGAVASRPARWGLVVSTLGFCAMALGMFLIMGSATGGVVGALSGERVFVSIGSPIVAVGAAVASLGKARDAWRDYARVLPPILAIFAGAFAFCALELARVLLR
jgi:eukaryotic-like serine/threonine-protein kinase